MSHPTFNLVDEPWIPVAMIDGSNTELSLSDLFARAHEAKGFNEPSPLTYVSVARFLLAVAHRTLNGPASVNAWVALWRRGQFDPAPFDDYFARLRHRFDLFDPEKPFAQADPDHDLGKEESPLSRFLLEEASVSAATLFDHSHDTNPTPFSPAQAARALLTAHNYAFAGTGGRYRDATLIRGYSLLLEGDSLFQTLVLNLVGYNDQSPKDLTRANDAPWWELDHDPPIVKDGSEPRGLTDLLTWRSRWMRLRSESDGTVVFSPYLQRYFLPQSFIADPFLGYAAVQGGANKGEIITRKFSVGRALWRDSNVLMEHQRANSTGEGLLPRPGIIDWFSQVAVAYEDETDEQLPEPLIVASGLVNNQAKIHLWRQERLPLPISVARSAETAQTVTEALSFAEETARALNSAGRRLAMALLTEGDRSPDKNDVSNQLTLLRLEERYWPRLELEFHDFLHDLDTGDRDAALVDWMRRGLRLARRSYDDASQVVGADARSIKAQVLGRRTLNRQLAPLHDRLEQYLHGEGELAS